jgi:hypothetical protein
MYRMYHRYGHSLIYFKTSSVGIALGCGLDDWGSRVRFPAGAGNFPFHHHVQNGSGAHPASNPMGTRVSFHGVKRPWLEADHLPPSSAEVKECVELYLYSPNTPPWRGAQLKHGDNFTFTFTFIFTFTWRVPSLLAVSFYKLDFLELSSLIRGRGSALWHFLD